MPFSAFSGIICDLGQALTPPNSVFLHPVPKFPNILQISVKSHLIQEGKRERGNLTYVVNELYYLEYYSSGWTLLWLTVSTLYFVPFQRFSFKYFYVLPPQLSQFRLMYFSFLWTFHPLLSTISIKFSTHLKSIQNYCYWVEISNLACFISSLCIVSRSWYRWDIVFISMKA